MRKILEQDGYEFYPFHANGMGGQAMDNINVFDGIKEQFPGRKFKRHNAEIWTMRSNVEENQKAGKILADKLNRAKGKTVLVLPLRGLSMVSGEGMELDDKEADKALFDTLKENVSEQIEILEVDAHINDPEFAKVLCGQIEKYIPRNKE